jgi:spore coat protein A
VRVKWINDDMPEAHLIEASIDRTIYRGNEYPDVRTVAHLYGGFTQPQYDGNPDAWSTPRAGETGPIYNPDDFVYPNEQPAAGLWYHDHAINAARLNVYAGLAGLYNIRDDVEDGLGLPSGEYEVPLMLQDRSLNEDASLFYPTQGVSAVHPVWLPIFTGDIAFVNGMAWPYLDVEPRRYRFRLLNASQARAWNLWFDVQGQRLGFHVVGSDRSLLPQAAPVESLFIASGERYDLVVDFADLDKDTTVTIMNDAIAPYPEGGGVAIDEVMQIRVSKELSGTDESTPATDLRLPEVPRLDTTGALVRRFILEEITEDDIYTSMVINRKLYRDAVEERPAAGSVEVWEFANLSHHMHPMRIRMASFQVLSRQFTDSQPFWEAWLGFYSGSGPMPDFDDYLKGPVEAAPAHEAGWKDTVAVHREEITRVAVSFDLPPDTPTPARYAYDCHILEHLDNEMMRPFDVV